MRKILCMLLAACILLTAAGCNGGNTGNAPPDSITGSGKAESTQSPSQESTASAPAETAQVDGSKVSFKHTTVSPEWKFIEGFNAQYDYRLVEDGQGTLHLIYDDYMDNIYHLIQEADGSWSELQPIYEMDVYHLEDFISGYRVGTAPDGSLYFASKKSENFRNELTSGDTDVFHIKYYKDGQWREDPKTYDFKDESGAHELSIGWFSVAFDAQGEPHFIYMAGENHYPPRAGGLCLDGTQLTQTDREEQTTTPIVQGVGNMSSSVEFYIDGENVYHLFGYDDSSNIKASSWDTPVYSRYLHSYSRDGGKTWEGPTVVFESDSGLLMVRFVVDSKGIIHLKANSSSLLTTTLNPASFEPENPEAHFSKEQIDDFTWGLPYEESSRYYWFGIDSIVLDSKDIPHFIRVVDIQGDMTEFWDITRIGGNAWAVREIEKPEECEKLMEFFLRRNGNFMLFAKETDKPEPALYYAEIPSER